MCRWRYHRSVDCRFHTCETYAPSGIITYTMDTKKIIKDLAIVGVILALGFFVYLAFPTQVAPQPQADTDLQNKQTIIMEPEETTAQLKIVVLKEGSGPSVTNGQTVSVHYTGKLTDGKIFDSSVGKKPLTVMLGAGQVIQGWDIGILSMKVGEKRELTIPPALAYGAQGFPGVIPPNATLIFEVELVGIQ